MGQNFGWNNDLQAGAAKNKLAGSAATWLEGQIVRGSLMEHWGGDDGFREQFLKRFDKTRGAIAAVEAISDLHHKYPTQSVQAFFDEVSIAVDLKHYNLTEDQKRAANYIAMRDQDILIMFQAGLHRKIRELALAGTDPPATAQALLDACVRIETTLKDTKPTHKVGEVQNSEAGSSDEDDAIEGSPEEQIAALKRQLKKVKAKDKSKLRCFEKDCQSTDHLVANCPIRKAKIRAREEGGRGRGGGGGWNNRGRGGGGWNWGAPRGYGYSRPPQRARGRWMRGAGGRGGRGRGQNYAYEVYDQGYDQGYDGQEGYENLPEEVAAGEQYNETGGAEDGYYDHSYEWYAGNE